MFDRIIFISDHGATIKLKNSENITMNLMNLHLVFEDETKKVLGEVTDVDGDTVKANFLGEIVGDRFLGGTIRKPRLDAKIRVINNEEILLITGKDEVGYMPLGNTPFYEGVPVYLDVNNFFSGHFAIMGNSGSGKSCGISRLFQNMFHDKRLNPCNANIIMFDSSGEYYNAFSNLGMINSNYNYRFITTNERASSEKLRIPIYLLNDADLALLLQVTNHSQLPMVERMRKLALVFSQKDLDANNYKNHLIAKAIMTILYTSETAPNKRNEIFSVLASCSTPQFNLEAVVQGIGYTRKFRECFLIDSSGEFSESVLLTEYVSSFIDDKLDAYEPKNGVFYTLDTLEKALNFTLISEGWLRNKNTYGDAVTLKVRLHSLIVSDMAKFFDVNQYMTVAQYLNSLVNADGRKYQFININLDDVDDDFAKVITKIFSRLIFDHSKSLTERASNPFHIVIEEAHRYIQNDNDRFLIGYNIFERIAKEGRKYGVILGIITQRPVELSDTVISQCSNFLIFKMNHPVDVDYIRKMVPNISDEIVEKQKTLQSGTCLGFGGAFRIPMIVKMEMPNPAPWSGNCDVVSFWGGGSATNGMMAPPSASAMSKPIASTLVANGFDPISSAVAVPSEMDKSTITDALVTMNVENPEVPEMHAGEFGLLSSEDSVQAAQIPTNASLVNLASDTSITNSSTGGVVSLPQVPKVEEASQVPSVPAIPNSLEMSTDTGVPLVSFVSGVSENFKSDAVSQANSSVVNDVAPSLVSFNTNPGNSMNDVNVNSIDGSNSVLSRTNPDLNNSTVVAKDTGSNVINTTVGVSGNPNLVSFSDVATGSTEVPQPVSMNVNPSGNATANNASLSNVTAAPQIDVAALSGGFKDNESDDEEVPSGINFVSTPEPSELGGGEMMSTLESPKNLEQSTHQNKMNDTFGKPDLSDFNTTNQMMNMGGFNPMNDINDNTISKGNDGFAPPTNINLSSSNDGSEPLQFNAGTSLVSFLDQM